MSNQLPSAVVLANCTHVSLAAALRKSGCFSEVESVEVYTVPVDDRARVASDLARFDFILTLEHAEGFGPLATAALRGIHGSKVFSLPTPFFSGTMPDMAYLTLRGEITRAPGILGDYHSALILAECAEGLPEEDIVRRYSDGSAFERMDIETVWKENIAELQRREESTDITISDYLISRGRLGLVAGDFLSFNHPCEGLINRIAGSFLNAALGIGSLDNPLTPEEHNLYRDARWPVHPAVAARLGLLAPADPKFKVPDRLGGQEMSIEEFARRSCRFFRSRNPVSHFRVHTPWYLGKAIHGSPVPPASESRARTRTHVVINHFGRSGSTVLAKMIEQHSMIAWLHEYFSHYSISSLETYDFSCDQMVSMVQAAAEKEWRQGGRFCVGHEIKLMNFLQNPACGMEEYLAATADPERFFHIVLLRRNTLRRILSVYKAAQTNVYHAEDNSYRTSGVRYTVDFTNLTDWDTGQEAATLPELLEKAQAAEEEVINLYRKLGISFHLLTYEDDIEPGPVEAYAKVLRWLGLPWQAASVKLVRTGSPLREEVENFDQVEQALAGTRFEWMLAG